MEKLKALLGKDMSMNELIMYMAKAAIENVEKVKFKQTDKPKSPPPAALVVSRSPSTEVKRNVYQRDKKCTHCGSYHHLNYDHREAYALGGKSDLENIRLLCFLTVISVRESKQDFDLDQI